MSQSTEQVISSQESSVITEKTISIASVPTEQKKKKKVKIMIKSETKTEVKPEVKAQIKPKADKTDKIVKKDDDSSDEEDDNVPSKKGATSKSHFDIYQQIDFWQKVALKTACFPCSSCDKIINIPYGMLNDSTIKLLCKCSCGKQVVYKKPCGNKECRSFIFQKHFDPSDKAFSANYCHQCVKKHKSKQNSC